MENQSNKLHTKFPTLFVYIKGAINAKWTALRDTLIAADPTLSSVRAGELAAAKIVKAASEEYELLFASVRNYLAITDEQEREELFTFHDKVINLSDEFGSMSSLLVELSGSRTLLADLELV